MFSCHWRTHSTVQFYTEQNKKYNLQTKANSQPHSSNSSINTTDSNHCFHQNFKGKASIKWKSLPCKNGVMSSTSPAQDLTALSSNPSGSSSIEKDRAHLESQPCQHKGDHQRDHVLVPCVDSGSAATSPRDGLNILSVLSSHDVWQLVRLKFKQKISFKHI